MAYVWLIAWQSVTKFLDGGIMVEVSTEHSEGLLAPAITFCVLGPSQLVKSSKKPSFPLNYF